MTAYAFEEFHNSYSDFLSFCQKIFLKWEGIFCTIVMYCSKKPVFSGNCELSSVCYGVFVVICLLHIHLFNLMPSQINKLFFEIQIRNSIVVNFSEK